MKPTPGPADRFVLGEWNAFCAICGGKFKASQLTKNWKGQRVCSTDWEPRHPQDFVRNVPRERPPPWTQPEGETPVISFCGPNDRTGIAGYATAGCAIANYIDPLFDPHVHYGESFS